MNRRRPVIAQSLRVMLQIFVLAIALGTPRASLGAQGLPSVSTMGPGYMLAEREVVRLNQARTRYWAAMTAIRHDVDSLTLVIDAAHTRGDTAAVRTATEARQAALARRPALLAKLAAEMREALLPDHQWIVDSAMARANVSARTDETRRFGTP